MNLAHLDLMSKDCYHHYLITEIWDLEIEGEQVPRGGPRYRVVGQLSLCPQNLLNIYRIFKGFMYILHIFL